MLAVLESDELDLIIVSLDHQNDIHDDELDEVIIGDGIEYREIDDDVQLIIIDVMHLDADDDEVEHDNAEVRVEKVDDEY